MHRAVQAVAARQAMRLGVYCVSEIPKERDYWRWPTMGLWIVFFGVGLVPERIFNELRDLAGITTYDAAVNSYQLITLGLAAYLGLFCYQRCREAGLPDTIAQAKAIQIGTLGLLAFLDVPFEQLAETRSPYHHFLLGIASAKMIGWLYLLSVIVRHYFWGQSNVFSSMITLIPSAYSSDSPEESNRGEEESEAAPTAMPEADGVNQSESDSASSDGVSAQDEPGAVEQDKAI